MRALLPYLMVVAGLVVVYESVPAVFSRSETEPTPTAASLFDPDVPSPKWIQLSGAGYFVACVAGEHQPVVGRNAAPARRYYVPILSPVEANAWTAAGNRSPEGTRTLLLACLTREEFQAAFPHFNARNARPETYRLAEMTGTVATYVPRKLKVFLENQYGVDHAGIRIFQLNAKPRSASEAFTSLVIGAALLLCGGAWIAIRMREGVPEVEDNYVPPVPEMPEGGWHAKSQDDRRAA